MLYTEIEPGASSSDQLKDEFGEQGGVVLEGELELTINDEVFTVRKGDSFQFPSATPHRYENKTNKPTKLVWIVSVR
ncbi:cupin domain [Pseudomonas fluorescens]|nr:cupin domain [Pseudomonas fluorescens]